MRFHRSAKTERLFDNFTSIRSRKGRGPECAVATTFVARNDWNEFKTASLKCVKIHHTEIPNPRTTHDAGKIMSTSTSLTRVCSIQLSAAEPLECLLKIPWGWNEYAAKCERASQPRAKYVRVNGKGILEIKIRSSVLDLAILTLLYWI